MRAMVNGDFIPQPCKKCPQACKRVAGRTRSQSALVPWTGGRKLEVCLPDGVLQFRVRSHLKKTPHVPLPTQ